MLLQSIQKKKFPPSFLLFCVEKKVSFSKHDVLAHISEGATDTAPVEVQENKCADGSSSACPLVVEDAGEAWRPLDGGHRSSDFNFM